MVWRRCVVYSLKIRWQTFISSNVSKRLGRNLGWLMVGNVSSLVLGFITTVYLARKLGQSEFGKFSYAQAIALYATYLVDLGLNVYGIRSVARHPDRSNFFLTHIVALQVAACVVLLMICGVIVLSGWLWLGIQLGQIVFISLIWVLPFALNIEWLFLGLERTKIVGFSRMIQQVSILSMTIVVVRGPEQLLYAPVIRVAGGLLSALWLFSSLPKQNYRQIRLIFKEIKVLLRGARWFWWSAMLLQISRSSDVLIIQAYRPFYEVGQYSASIRLAGVVTAAIGIVNTVMFSMLAHEKEQNSRDFTRLLKTYLLIAGCIAGVSLIVGLPGAPLILTMVYGKAYADTAPLFSILLLAGVCLVFQGAIEQPLLACGYERSVFTIIAVTAALSLAANIFFVPTLGIYGASITYLICAIFSLLSLCIMYRRASIYGDLSININKGT